MTLECFDLRNNKCHCSRGHANIVTMNDKLYLCGTIGGIITSFISRISVISSVLSIDVYNKEQDTWEHCSDTVIAHHNAGTTSVSFFNTPVHNWRGNYTDSQCNRIFRSVDFFLH